MGKKIRVGIIGCGGRVRGLAKSLVTRFPEIGVEALADPNAESVKWSRAELNPDAKVYDDHSALCASDVDWVMVGSWNALHRDHAVAALEAGKHVFCEKPLATSVDDCIAMRDAVAKSGRIFSFGLTLRYSGLYRRIRSLIDAGGIGKVVSFEFSETLGFNHGGYIHSDWRRHRKYAGTHMLEKCCHDMDLANWFAGALPVKAASFGGLDFFLPKNEHHVARIGPSANGKQAFRSWIVWPDAPSAFNDDKDIIDNQVAVLLYENGVRCTFHTNCMAGIPERRMMLLGTEGAIRADLCTGTVEHRRIGWDEPSHLYSDVGGGHGDGDHHLVENLAASMLSGKAPRAGIVQGITSALSCFGIDAAMESGQVFDLAPLWKRAGVDPRICPA
jgi:predicted dehydrogenase